MVVHPVHFNSAFFSFLFPRTEMYLRQEPNLGCVPSRGLIVRVEGLAFKCALVEKTPSPWYVDLLVLFVSAWRSLGLLSGSRILGRGRDVFHPQTCSPAGTLRRASRFTFFASLESPLALDAGS